MQLYMHCWNEVTCTNRVVPKQTIFAASTPNLLVFPHGKDDHRETMIHTSGIMTSKNSWVVLIYFMGSSVFF